MKKKKLTFNQKRKVAQRFSENSGLSTLLISKKYLESAKKITDEIGLDHYAISIKYQLESAVLYGLVYMENYLSNEEISKKTNIQVT